VKPQFRPVLDPRRTPQTVREILARRPGYVPDWLPLDKGSDAALLWIFARYLETILQRLNQAPEKNKLAFLDLLGIDLIPAQAARAPVVFQLSEKVADTYAPAGTRVVAPPPPESSDQIIFETEQTVGLAAACLKQVFSLWPGRDQYIDHTTAFENGEAFQPFQRRMLEDTPHHIYVAHDTLLALAGEVTLNLAFELTQDSSEHLDIVWEYWDGEVWRGFKAMHPTWAGEQEEKLDSTDGLTRSGRFLLKSDCAQAAKTTVNGIEAFWIRGWLKEPLPPDPAQVLPLVESIKIYTEIVRPLGLPPAEDLIQTDVAEVAGLALVRSSVEDTGDEKETETVVSGLKPDSAFFGAEQLDTSQAFYPLGQVPKPGDVFYFSSEEIFSKPGAEVTVYLDRAETPYEKLDIIGTSTKDPLKPELKWEYWNGRRWQDLAVETVSSSGQADELPQNFQGGGAFKFKIQPDMSPTEVNGEEALWIRARLVKHGYGFSATVTWNDNTNSFTHIVNQPPALSDFRLGYAWQYGPFHPEKVLTYNDFQYEDHTEEAKWPGQVFQPFQLLRDVTPALYLGFDKELPVNRLNLYFDIEEDPRDARGPALLWEYWDGFNWRNLAVADETNHLRVPGMLSLIGPEDSEPYARFGTSLYWLRGRLKEDGPPGAPTVNGIFLNAVWASQRQTVTDEPIGASNGQPDQVFAFRQIPVLKGERIEVRELAGPRADVEWRILAMEILGEDYGVLQELEDMLRQEGPQTECGKGDLRLRRDRNKRVTEVWVRWQGQKHLFFSGPNDRHYVLERSRGRLIFGDGEHGRVPPPGAAIMAKQYRTGGGLAGNVTAGSINQMLAGIGGVEAVFNPKAAEGGADAETLAALASRGPQSLRHRGRALAPGDYETMAKEASPAVAVARAMATRDNNGRPRPGWVTLVIIPQSEAPRPWPSFGLREQVRRYIAGRAPADVVAADHMYITGPMYQEIDVAVTVVPLDSAEAGTVEQRVRQALANFFHPLRGGPEGRGWTPGRHVFLSDVASVLERVAGVDYVKELSLLLNGVLQRERARVADGRIPVAGEIRIRILAG
jgi:uncharacterized phage protein gp47/JayE